MTDDLFEAARAVRDHAHAPYSGFKVGAALRAEDGSIHVGANVENAAYPQGQCAEASALGALVAAGARRVVEVCIVADGPALIAPCGGCRQRLVEFAVPDTPVHLGDTIAVRRTVTLADLLPLAFDSTQLTAAATPGDAAHRLRALGVIGEARIAILLGSGLARVAERLELPETVAYADLAGFPKPSVEGHAGEVVAGRLAGVPVLALKGRVHLYEGVPASAVTPIVQALKAVGIRLMILTNAAGAIAERLRPGDLALITDHINALGTSPLIGRNDDALGPRFPDMSEVYDAALRSRLRTVAEANGIDVGRGVYLATLGPAFETPAEIRAFATLGADLVGMSTVPEAIAARHAGLRVLGISAVTNKAAGLGPPLRHSETLAVGAACADRLADLLVQALPELHNDA